jgi:hypothetical protein
MIASTPVTPSTTDNVLHYGWPLVTAVYRDYALPFPAEPTVAPGLVIVPAVNVFTRSYLGGWTVLHTRSGKSFGITSVPVTYAREAAHLLADTGIDWTVSAAELRQPGRHAMVLQICDQIRSARIAGRPAWWARTSWQHIRPAWLVCIAESVDDGYYQFDTWPELVTWLDRQRDIDPLYRPQAITREDAGTWRLTCAAPLCDNHLEDATRPAVLGDQNEAGSTFEIRYPDRGDVAREARDLGWQRHDLWHWTCPACIAAHPRDIVL